MKPQHKCNVFCLSVTKRKLNHVFSRLGANGDFVTIYINYPHSHKSIHISAHQSIPLTKRKKVMLVK